MKKIKYIILVVFCLGLFNANASNSEIENVRQSISLKLNSAVKELKEKFSESEDLLNGTQAYIETVDDKVDVFIEASKNADETNPNILTPGRTPLDDCDEATEKLTWAGSVWQCDPVSVATDCEPASDEYKYIDINDVTHCTKHAYGKSINYYWSYRGYSPRCNTKTENYLIEYSCVYKNKLNIEVEVSSSYCSNLSKPKVDDKNCMCMVEESTAVLYRCPANQTYTSGKCTKNPGYMDTRYIQHGDAVYCNKWGYVIDAGNCKSGRWDDCKKSLDSINYSIANYSYSALGCDGGYYKPSCAFQSDGHKWGRQASRHSPGSCNKSSSTPSAYCPSGYSLSGGRCLRMVKKVCS